MWIILCRLIPSFIKGVLWGIFCLWLSACTEPPTHNLPSPKPSTFDLPVVKAQMQTVPRWYYAPGHVVAAQRIEIAAKTNGFIQKIAVQEGEIVKAGALLALIDNAQVSSAIAQAKAVLQSAQVSVRDAMQDVKNYRRLNKKNVLSAEKLRKAELRLSLGQVAVTKAQALLKAQRAEQIYLRLTSPIKARVVERLADVGDLASPGVPILRLEALQPFEFETAIPAQWVRSLQRGQNVPIQFDGLPKAVNGKITHIIHAADPITQTCKIKLTLPAKQLTGLFGKALFTVNTERLLTIPEKALIKRVGVTGVYQVDQDKNAYFVSVHVGKQWQQQRVILAGLNSGDIVVQTPPLQLHDGSKIR
jgi:RND family efflux transporter MFP subunit